MPSAWSVSSSRPWRASTHWSFRSPSTPISERHGTKPKSDNRLDLTPCRSADAWSLLRVRMVRFIICALLLLSAACEQAPIPQRLRRQKPRSPRIKAKVLIVRTNLLPQNQAFVHLVILSEQKIRVGNDAD